MGAKLKLSSEIYVHQWNDDKILCVVGQEFSYLQYTN